MSVPKNSFDFAFYLSAVEERGLLPENALCVYNAGSLVLGWGNATSDADYYVVTTEPWTGEVNNSNPSTCEQGWVPSTSTYVGDRRIDVEYWQDKHLGQIINNVSWERYDNNIRARDLVTNHDFEVLQRIGHAQALRGADYLEHRREQVAKSALNSIGVSHNLYYSDVYLEDAVGQMEAGDNRSAVLSARAAFDFAIDALLFYHGGVGGNTPINKWRARHLAEVEQNAIPFDQYWAVETMRDYDDAKPQAWVETAVLACRQISLAISVA